MDFAYLFRVLLKRKWIIIGATVLSALVAWFLTKNEKNYFQSTSRISTGFAIPDGIQVNEKNYTLFDAEVKFNNAINMWNSPSVISLLSYSLILHDLTSPTPFRTLDAKQMQSPAYKAVNKQEARKLFEEKLQNMSMLTSFKPEEKKLIEFLRIYGYDYPTVSKSISIYQVNRTDYIQVDATTEHPDLSAYICNMVYEQFIRYYKSVRGSRSQESVDTLQSIMDKKKAELDEKNRLLRGEGGNLSAESMNTSNLDLIAQYEKDITTERNKQTDNYYALRKINQRLNESGAGGNTNTNPLTENEELIIARRAMNNAYQEYLRTNDKASQDKYNQLKNEFNTKYANASSATGTTTVNRKELQEKKADLEVDIEASNEKIRVIEGKIASLRGSVNSTSSRSANVETMMEEVKVAENEYFDAKRRYNEAYDMSFSAVNNFRQIQIAQPAIEPLPSKRKMVVGLAGVVTGICVVLVIVLLTYLDSSVRTPQIFSRTVNLKLISLVNFMNLKSKDLKNIVAGQAKKDDRRLDKEKGHAFRESIRKLRFEIESTGKKIFLFTSTKKGEGKTTLIQALAYSLSLSNKKVLIIDTNFCNNDLTVQMNAEPVLEKLNIDHKGKTDREFAEKIRQLAKPIDDTTISVIGSEGGDYTPSEILPTENILRSLSSLSSEFDFILLEGPPLNDFTDSRELLQYVDGVIGIFSADRIIKQIDKESISFFRDLNGKFCGAVLNKVNFENVNTA